MSARETSWRALALLALSAIACEDEGTSSVPSDARAGGADASLDSSSDAKADAALEGAVDAALDAKFESGAAEPLTTRAFRKRVIDSQFRAEGVAIFDVDNDARPDIVTDQFWYSGSGFQKREIRTPETFDPEPAYSRNNAVYAMDVNGDGFTDSIVVGFPGTEIVWYENPRAGADVHWQRHVLAERANIETPVFVDLFNDGKKELVVGFQSDQTLPTVVWLEPAADVDALWTMHAISAPGAAPAEQFAHGLGAGDLNGDGRADVLTALGWFEGPADRASTPWLWHPFAFHPNECSQMYVWDVNADGRADVISSNPHHYGVWWWEQLPSAAGAELAFAEHAIDTRFSESHALELEDLDADGTPEIVTGKRFYSHGKNEQGALDPPLLVYYRRILDGAAAGGARFERVTIDDDSGVGTQFAVADVSGDFAPDIVVSNKRGLFYFERDARCQGAEADSLRPFNGRDLSGFYPWFPASGRRDPKRVFSVHDGMLHVLDIAETEQDQEFGYLTSAAEFADFRLRFEYRFGTKQFNPPRREGWRLDSGFFVTLTGQDQIWPRAQECQVQVGDTGDLYMFDRATFGTRVADPALSPPTFAELGSAYTTPRNANPNWIPTRVVHAAAADHATDWNQVEIVITGETSEYRVNGQTTLRGVSRKQPSPLAPDDPSRDVPLLRGRIAFQEEGAEIFYRNLKITGLAPARCANE